MVAPPVVAILSLVHLPVITCKSCPLKILAAPAPQSAESGYVPAIDTREMPDIGAGTIFQKGGQGQK